VTRTAIFEIHFWNTHFENMETELTYETDDNVKKQEPGKQCHQVTGCEWSENVHIFTYSLLKCVST
jgi:hypothetical protein